jgi:hypothetical protein
MKKTLLTIIMTFGLLEVLVAQDIRLPKRISITDEFSSCQLNSFLYKYKLILSDTCYSIRETINEENGEKKNGNKRLGTIDKKLIENILLMIKLQPTKEVQAKDFEDIFTLDAINNFLEKKARNYWINNEYQKEFIIEELTNPNKLKKNIEQYLKYYDHSGYTDGTYTKVTIKFHFSNTTLSISSESILWTGLPIEINGERNFSPKLAALIGELIPESGTERKEQFNGVNFFSAVIQETINNYRKQISNLESKNYQVYIDSLMDKFVVSDPTVINGTFSTNWNGEKRLNCILTDSSMVSNASINYSTTIEDGKIKYPVSLILTGHKQLYSLVNMSAINNRIALTDCLYLRFQTNP